MNKKYIIETLDHSLVFATASAWRDNAVRDFIAYSKQKMYHEGTFVANWTTRLQIAAAERAGDPLARTIHNMQHFLHLNGKLGYLPRDDRWETGEQEMTHIFQQNPGRKFVVLSTDSQAFAEYPNVTVIVPADLI